MTNKGVQRGRGGRSQGFGVATRVMECCQDFGVAPRVLEENVKIYLTFYEKSFIKGTLKPKIEKRALLLLFYCLLSDICKKKNRKFQSK